MLLIKYVFGSKVEVIYLAIIFFSAVSPHVIRLVASDVKKMEITPMGILK
jgi:hypothetical protein